MDQAPAPAAAQMKLSSDYKENALLKELLASPSDYKFTLAPSQNKLTNIKLLPAWFQSIQRMLDRYPDTEMFLFGTAAALNDGKNLTFKTTSCKTESVVKIEEASGSKLTIINAIQQELQAFQQGVNTYQLFADFMRDSEFEAEINLDSELKTLVAPVLFPRTTPNKVLQGAKLFMSPQYQETVTLGDKINGKQRITDETDFTFPSSIRIGTAKHVTFHYIKGL